MAAERDAGERRHYEYRGRMIEVAYRVSTGTAKAADAVTLRIDGEEIPVESTSDGVTSHAAAFMVFGTPEELAEELIRQWGTGRGPRRPSTGQPKVRKQKGH